MRALVIDDEQLVLEGLEAFLQVSLPDFSLDKTASVRTAFHLASTVPYQLVLLDWNLVDADGSPIDGRGLVDTLRRAGSMAPIIVVSGDGRSDWPQLLLELGLSGFVPKSASGPSLIDAIHVALRGGIYLPSQAMMKARPRTAQVTPGDADPRQRFPSLTERQSEVFRVMIKGLSDKQIARELGISESTVKTHVSAILNAVGVDRRGKAIYEATASAIRRS